MRMCNTRWLSIAPCIDRILQQFDALTKHFERAIETERCFNADKLYKLYANRFNKVYLEFLNPYLESEQDQQNISIG